MAANASFQNIKSTMKTEHALPLQECRLSEAVERPWGRSYRTVEWTLKNDHCWQVSVVPAKGLFYEERIRKTEDELKLLRQAMAITEAGLARAMEVLRASASG